MVFSSNQRGKLRIKVLDLQLVTVDHLKEELEHKFPCSLNSLPENIQQPKIIHFCGRKPFMYDVNSFSKPFTSCRIAHYQNLYKSQLEIQALCWLQLFKEEMNILIEKAQKRFGFLFFKS